MRTSPLTWLRGLPNNKNCRNGTTRDAKKGRPKRRLSDGIREAMESVGVSPEWEVEIISAIRRDSTICGKSLR